VRKRVIQRSNCPVVGGQFIDFAPGVARIHEDRDGELPGAGESTPLTGRLVFPTGLPLLR